MNEDTIYMNTITWKNQGPFYLSRIKKVVNFIWNSLYGTIFKFCLFNFVFMHENIFYTRVQDV